MEKFHLERCSVQMFNFATYTCVCVYLLNLWTRLSFCSFASTSYFPIHLFSSANQGLIQGFKFWHICWVTYPGATSSQLVIAWFSLHHILYFTDTDQIPVCSATFCCNSVSSALWDSNYHLISMSFSFLSTSYYNVLHGFYIFVCNAYYFS